MATFCSNCGAAIPDGARFCGKCGHPIRPESQDERQPETVLEQPEPRDEASTGQTQKETQAPSESAESPEVGTEKVEDKAPESENSALVTESENTEPEARDVEPSPEAEPQISEGTQKAPGDFVFNAQSSSGEALLGSLESAVSGAAADVIPGPGKVIATSIKTFFSSIGSAFKEPKRLVPAIVLAVIWLTLNILQACGINPLPTQILSFLTFANGGMSGGVIGAIGGIIGKGLFAGAVGSLIGLLARGKTAGKRSFGDTLKGAFGVSSDTLWVYLTGIGAAMLLYLFISGGATRMAFMGGIAASFLSARSALNNGVLRKLIASFTSKGKEKEKPGVAGFMRGLTAGFAAASFIGLIGISLILIIVGALLFVGGVVMTILQAKGVVKIGKEAGK